MKELNKDNYIFIRANNEFKKEYKKLCESHGYTYSKRIIALIEKDFEYLRNLKDLHI